MSTRLQSRQYEQNKGNFFWKPKGAYEYYRCFLEFTLMFSEDKGLFVEIWPHGISSLYGKLNLEVKHFICDKNNPKDKNIYVESL